MKLSFSNDKFLHFMISFLLIPFFYLLTDDIVIAFVLANLTGIIKEIYDYISPHHVFDLKDILFNVLGTITSIVFLIMAGVV